MFPNATAIDAIIVIIIVFIFSIKGANTAIIYLGSSSYKVKKRLCPAVRAEHSLLFWV